MADVRPATPDDRELLARIAAEGFFHDPVLSWAIQDEVTRLDKLIHLFGGMVDDMLPDRGRVDLADASSAAFWREPGFDEARTAADRLEDAPAAEPPPYSEDEMARTCGTRHERSLGRMLSHDSIRPPPELKPVAHRPRPKAIG